MKQVFLMIGQNLLRQFLTPADHGPAPSVTLLEPIKDYAAEAVRKYAIVAGFTLFFSLYFVAGTLMMITAAANSFDAFGFFAPGTFFYSGVAITIISATVLAGCYVSLKKESKKKKEAPEVLPAPKPEFPVSHLVEALATGVISGIISRRLSRPAPPTTLREKIRRVI